MKNSDRGALTPFTAPLPDDASAYPKGYYDTLPAFTLAEKEIDKGYGGLAARIAAKIPVGLRVLVIDGFPGVAWDSFLTHLQAELLRREIRAELLRFDAALADPAVREATLRPFLGGEDRLFGKHWPFGPEIFFDPLRVEELRITASLGRAENAGRLTIIAGSGASLVELWDELWYIDLPKDLIQDKFRAGAAGNVGVHAADCEAFYKRCYFVEWPAFSRLKRSLLPRLDIFIDGQDEDDPSWMTGGGFCAALEEISRSPFRVRPWFYPGPWGGQFMKGHMNLDPGKPNYAWSFEMIVPENGIVFRSGSRFLECSFDFLMFAHNRSLLGPRAAAQFIHEWPIRFDYLDTIDGGNLSVQVHPRPDYIKKEFGETYTQDECYYIVNAQPGARVYLGLQEHADLEEFKQALLHSQATGEELDVEAWIHSEPSGPHDLFFIPNGTVHCSGRGNLVLEISATPYIFTMKLYDYLRRDLEGRLRPINLERGFANIRPERRGKWVSRNLVARPKLIEESAESRLYELYNHPWTFYVILRAEFAARYTLLTEGRGFAVNLVEGERVEVHSANGRVTSLAYLETMLIPAAAEAVTFVNRGDRPCRLVLVYVKPEAGLSLPVNEPND
ncbi:MAG TPA: class I mannose-6-phosphate isomerase [bacterium]|nr:class I mannose-6-phosphate isomerase [bacterium]HPR87525.1 class I mannose-6-phosphate isomerase [bacterium]